MKFWNSEISNVYTLNFQSFRIPHFWNCEYFFSVSNKLLSSFFLHHQLISIIWVLWKSFVKMYLFNDNFFHFQKSLMKPKLKTESNRFLIWISWHSCVLKRNNVPWFPWFQMAKSKYISSFLWQNLMSNVFHGSFISFWLSYLRLRLYNLNLRYNLR